MRKEKGTRTCKCCFTTFSKYNLKHNIIQIGLVDNNYVFNKIYCNTDIDINNAYMQNGGKTMYICSSDKCIDITIKNRKIEKFLGKKLNEKECETLKQMSDKYDKYK